MANLNQPSMSTFFLSSVMGRFESLRDWRGKWDFISPYAENNQSNFPLIGRSHNCLGEIKAANKNQTVSFLSYNVQ